VRGLDLREEGGAAELGALWLERVRVDAREDGPALDPLAAVRGSEEREPFTEERGVHRAGDRSVGGEAVVQLSVRPQEARERAPRGVELRVEQAEVDALLRGGPGLVERAERLALGARPVERLLGWGAERIVRGHVERLDQREGVLDVQLRERVIR